MVAAQLKKVMRGRGGQLWGYHDGKDHDGKDHDDNEHNNDDLQQRQDPHLGQPCGCDWAE